MSPRTLVDVTCQSEPPKSHSESQDILSNDSFRISDGTGDITPYSHEGRVISGSSRVPPHRRSDAPYVTPRAPRGAASPAADDSARDQGEDPFDSPPTSPYK